MGGGGRGGGGRGSTCTRCVGVCARVGVGGLVCASECDVGVCVYVRVSVSGVLVCVRWF